MRKSSLSQVLNAEAYMLFYKKGVGLAKLTLDDDASNQPMSTNGKFHDSNQLFTLPLGCVGCPVQLFKSAQISTYGSPDERIKFFCLTANS